MLGTLGFMSPEQAAGHIEQVDERDGVILVDNGDNDSVLALDGATGRILLTIPYGEGNCQYSKVMTAHRLLILCSNLSAHSARLVAL